MRIIPKTENLAGYLFCFLNSIYGKTLIKRETYGAVVDMIDPTNASAILIPILKNQQTQKRINELALQANKLRSEAYYKEQDALKLMNETVIYAKD